MTRYMILEQNRLEAEVAELDARLATSKAGPGLKTRSVRSFLAELRRHKRGMLKDIDYRLAETSSVN